MKNFWKQIVISILYLESKFLLFLKRPEIIAITGTVGKTTTKDILYAGLKDSFCVRKSPKGFNSDIGVPLTILGLETQGTSTLGWIKNIIKGIYIIFFKKYPDMLIVEVGANYPNEIRKNAKLLKPNIVVFTNLPEIMAHMEFFENRQHFIEEKLSLAQYLKKEGTIIYNGDDKTLVKEIKKSKFDSCNKKTFGKSADFEFKKIIIYQEDNVLKGTSIILDDNIDIRLVGVLGEHLGYSVSALLAVSNTLNLEQSKIIIDLEKNFVPTAGRMRVFEGIHDSTIIDDSYNALPESVKNGSNLLQRIDTDGRKIFVLGRLAELGSYSEKSYEKAVNYIKESCEIIFLVNDGGVAKKYAKNLNFKEIYSFNNKGNDYFANTDEVGIFLQSYIKKGDVVIFKGARHSTGFERAISKLVKEKDKKYLVQEHLK
jgi:UDP-N-acetylmuramoyl-tripeptide--D-alanyl-D-alanine ligase